MRAKRFFRVLAAISALAFLLMFLSLHLQTNNTRIEFNKVGMSFSSNRSLARLEPELDNFYEEKFILKIIKAQKTKPYII